MTPTSLLKRASLLVATVLAATLHLRAPEPKPPTRHILPPIPVSVGSKVPLSF